MIIIRRSTPRPQPLAGQHPVFERPHELFVVLVRVLLRPRLLAFALFDEAAALLDRVVDVGAAADDLHPGDDPVEGLAERFGVARAPA